MADVSVINFGDGVERNIKDSTARTGLASKTDKSVIAPAEEGTTSAAAYAIGDFFIRNGALCTATAPIAIGDTLTENTNYTAGSVSELLGSVSGIVPTSKGGTGNADGYIRTGIRTGTTAGSYATIEGTNNSVTGSNGAHAEGSGNTVSGGSAHAEGVGNTASGANSHAGGNLSTANAENAFAHGRDNIASAANATAFGHGVHAGYSDQFAVGKYNENKSTSILEVGIGTGDGTRTNGLEMTSDGSVSIAGSFSAKGYIDDGYGHRLGYSRKSKVDPFTSSTISLYHNNGITVTSSSVTAGTGAISFSEAQAGFEGFVIELNVTAGKAYKVEFDYQNTNCQYWENPSYTLGWMLEQTARTNYQDYGLWPNNIQRVSTVQHLSASIVANTTKVYMNFNVCGYSDAVTNYADITNLNVYELLEDNGPGNKVYVWETRATDATVSYLTFPDVTGIPSSFDIGDLIIIRAQANFTYNGQSGYSWNFGFIPNPSDPLVDIIEVDLRYSGGDLFKANISKGTCLTFVYTGITPSDITPRFILVSTEMNKPMDQTATLSTSASTPVTFTRGDITTNSLIDVAVSEWGLVPEDVTVSTGSCTVTLPSVDSARTVDVRIYVR